MRRLLHCQLLLNDLTLCYKGVYHAFLAFSATGSSRGGCRNYAAGKNIGIAAGIQVITIHTLMESVRQGCCSRMMFWSLSRLRSWRRPLPFAGNGPVHVPSLGCCRHERAAADNGHHLTHGIRHLLPETTCLSVSQYDP